MTSARCFCIYRLTVSRSAGSLSRTRAFYRSPTRPRISYRPTAHTPRIRFACLASIRRDISPPACRRGSQSRFRSSRRSSISCSRPGWRMWWIPDVRAERFPMQTATDAAGRSVKWISAFLWKHFRRRLWRQSYFRSSVVSSQWTMCLEDSAASGENLAWIRRRDPVDCRRGRIPLRGTGSGGSAPSGSCRYPWWSVRSDETGSQMFSVELFLRLVWGRWTCVWQEHCCNWRWSWIRIRGGVPATTGLGRNLQHIIINNCTDRQQHQNRRGCQLLYRCNKKNLPHFTFYSSSWQIFFHFIVDNCAARTPWMPWKYNDPINSSTDILHPQRLICR